MSSWPEPGHQPVEAIGWTSLASPYLYSIITLCLWPQGPPGLWFTGTHLGSRSSDQIPTCAYKACSAHPAPTPLCAQGWWQPHLLPVGQPALISCCCPHDIIYISGSSPRGPPSSWKVGLLSFLISPSLDHRKHRLQSQKSLASNLLLPSSSTVSKLMSTVS